MNNKMIAMVFLAVLILLPACGGDKDSTPTAVGTETTAPAGKVYECKYFTMNLAEGWDAGPMTFGMINVLPKGKVSPGLYFKFEGDGNAAGTAESSINSMIENYGGSPMEDSIIAATTFKTTTYAYRGMTQTMHVAFRNGTKITITIEGPKAKENADIQSMLKTLALN
ncbi:MAG: hypothetical protein JXI33_07110 [Candidatus Aminicenantes bacterium]|nr:hypothetical protein [Candidatus Aminicenantes bacterium]